MRRSLTQKGRLRLTYEIALSSGKPEEKNETRKSLLGENESYPHDHGGTEETISECCLPFERLKRPPSSRVCNPKNETPIKK